ncbi:hypothetical protein SKAU_G00032030 [Synaphobranchus kaupii]|uniref:C2H2-type domain-containing protein n=1 Tax=Synaphobranchus kaupii TaxID=118154 RepID=A0A9Q1JF79_SYNKA|nr:hypothetical protein SKAU_G00032030 [Synaphobranchus kaupii]
MEENSYMFTFQVQLDSCMDSLLKRTTAEITALVKDKFAQTQNNVVSNETDKCLVTANRNNPERQSEKSKAEKTPVIFGEPETDERQTDTEILLEFQTQLTSCMDCLLKQAMVEIIAWVKDTVVQFHSKIAAKETEIQHLAEQLHVLETQTQVTLKAVGFGSSEDQPSVSPVVFEEIERIHSDAVGLEQDKGSALVRNVPEAACFVEAEPAVDYELTVETTAMDEGNLSDGPQGGLQDEKEEVVLEVSNTYAGAWGAEESGGSPPSVSAIPADAATPLLHALEPGAAPHSCSRCWKSFSKEWVLHRHMRKHGEGGAGRAGGHDCPHCGRGFKHRKGLASHLRSHSDEKPYSCDVCGQRFTRPESAKKHQRLHSGVKPYTCPQCPKRFFRSDGLKSHLRTHEGRKRPATAAQSRPKLCMCSHCGKAYANATQVANHERTHTGERPYECGQCHKRFRHSGALSVHRITHQRERPHTCPTCPKSFRCAKHLKRHLLTHSEVRPFACDQCPLSFRTANELKAHKLRHGLQRTHGCPDCGKSFKTEYEVKLHRRAHNGERPYPCPNCERTFRRLHHLTSHRLTHTGERPYACDLCPRRFIRAREMRNHKRKVHLAMEEPLRCAPCQVSFDSLLLLEAHRHALHGETEEKLLEGLQRFPRILPRKAGAEQGAQQRVGAAGNPGAQRGAKVLGPVVFLLAGQGVSIPILASATVMTPMTTVAKVPIMPVSRAPSKTLRKAPVPDTTPEAKGERTANLRSSLKPPSGTETKPVARTPLTDRAKASTRTPPKPGTQTAAAAKTLLKTNTRSLAKPPASATPSTSAAGAATPPETPPTRPAGLLPNPSHPLEPKAKRVLQPEQRL